MSILNYNLRYPLTWFLQSALPLHHSLGMIQNDLNSSFFSQNSPRPLPRSTEGEIVLSVSITTGRFARFAATAASLAPVGLQTHRNKKMIERWWTFGFYRWRKEGSVGFSFCLKGFFFSFSPISIWIWGTSEQFCKFSKDCSSISVSSFTNTNGMFFL